MIFKSAIALASITRKSKIVVCENVRMLLIQKLLIYKKCIRSLMWLRGGYVTMPLVSSDVHAVVCCPSND